MLTICRLRGIQSRFALGTLFHGKVFEKASQFARKIVLRCGSGNCIVVQRDLGRLLEYLDVIGLVTMRLQMRTRYARTGHGITYPRYIRIFRRFLVVRIVYDLRAVRIATDRKA